MAKRLRDKNVCGLPEDEKLWAIGRGFVVRDLPWSEAKLREIPPFEFENWAVIALGGIPNVTKVGDMGIDGRIYPVSAAPTRVGKETGHLEFMDVWYPIQVKQKDKVGRPDIDAFEAMMTREDRKLGYFIGFDFSGDARFEIDRFQRKEGREIRALTVQEILDEHLAAKRREHKTAAATSRPCRTHQHYNLTGVSGNSIRTRCRTLSFWRAATGSMRGSRPLFARRFNGTASD